MAMCREAGGQSVGRKVNKCRRQVDNVYCREALGKSVGRQEDKVKGGRRTSAGRLEKSVERQEFKV